MALKPCTECGKSVSTNAKTCPNCGAPAPRGTSKVGIFIGTIIVLAVVVNAVKTNRPTAFPETPLASTAPPIPTIPEAEHKKQVEAAVSGMELSRDQIEKISFYSVPASNIFDDHLSAYVSLPDRGSPILRINFSYHDDNWIFWNEVKIMSDDVIVYSREFPRVSRDNNTAGVFESVDFAATPDEITTLRAIVMAKSSTMRLSGKDRRKDYTLSKKVISRLKVVLDTYDNLRKIPSAQL